MSEPRHIVAVYLDERLLDLMLRDGAVVRTLHGIPRDAVLLGISGDFSRMQIVAHFEHPSFPPWELGSLPSLQGVTFEILEHPDAMKNYDYIPVRYGPDESEVLNLRQWILDRAAAILGVESLASLL